MTSIFLNNINDKYHSNQLFLRGGKGIKRNKIPLQRNEGGREKQKCSNFSKEFNQQTQLNQQSELFPTYFHNKHSALTHFAFSKHEIKLFCHDSSCLTLMLVNCQLIYLPRFVSAKTEPAIAESMTNNGKSTNLWLNIFPPPRL